MKIYQRVRLYKVLAPQELVNHKRCFHMNDNFPHLHTEFNLITMDDSAKAGIVEMIEKGRIYLEEPNHPVEWEELKEAGRLNVSGTSNSKMKGEEL